MTGYVLVTRHPGECRELHDLLQPHGLAVRPYPVLRVADVDDIDGWRNAHAIAEEHADNVWLVISSPRAPERLVKQATERGANRLLRLPIAAIGEATASAAAQAKLSVQLVGPGSGFGLAKDLIPLLEPESPVIFVCGEQTRHELVDTLMSVGHPVEKVVVYRMAPTPPRELPPPGPDLVAVVVTSPRSARLYLDSVGGRPLPIPHWALGPTTQQAAAALGIECRVPPQPNFKSLAEALCQS